MYSRTGSTDATTRTTSAGRITRTRIVKDEQNHASIQKKPFIFRPFSSKKTTVRDYAVFFHQWVAFNQAQQPIVSTFAKLAEYTDKPELKATIEQARRDIEQRGSTIADALERTGQFSAVAVSLIRAGEAVDVLPAVLTRIAEYEQKVDEFRNKIKESTYYAKILIVMAISALVFAVVDIIPRFQVMYDGLGVEMTGTVKTMMSLNAFIQTYPYIALPLFVFLGIMLLRFREFFPSLSDNIFLRIPLYGKVYRTEIMYRFAYTLNLLLSNQITPREALELTAGAVDNHYFTDVISRTIPLVEQGKPLAEALRAADKQNLFDSLCLGLIECGQDADDIATLLNSASQFYETTLEQEVKIFAKQLENFMYVPIAFVVYIVLSTVYGPITQMSKILMK